MQLPSQPAPDANVNRRKFERFRVSPMYTPITVREGGMVEGEFGEGHAYDLSEGGVQFELDRFVLPGTAVTVQITLPTGGAMWDDLGPGRSVLAFGNVIWADESEPGPVRHAVAFTTFARVGDKERLLKQLGSGRFARAA